MNCVTFHTLHPVGGAHILINVEQRRVEDVINRISLGRIPRQAVNEFRDGFVCMSNNVRNRLAFGFGDGCIVAGRTKPLPPIHWGAVVRINALLMKAERASLARVYTAGPAARGAHEVGVGFQHLLGDRGERGKVGEIDFGAELVALWVVRVEDVAVPGRVVVRGGGGEVD